MAQRIQDQSNKINGRRTMNRYKSQTPRATLAIAAFALAALTLCLSVIAPAAIEGHPVTASKLTTPGAIDADIVPARIDVFGVREKMISLQPVVPPAVKK